MQATGSGSARDALPPQHPDLVTPNSLPHCELPSTRRAASAAHSVEAVQQDGDDEVVGRIFGGVVSLPTAYATRHQRTAQSQQQPIAPLSTQTTSHPTGNLLEHRSSVVYDSKAQPESKLSRQQQSQGQTQAALQSQKHSTSGSPAVSQQQSQPHVMPSLSPECSAASEGLADVRKHEEACQAAPDMTQQATIQEASLQI